MRPGIGLAALMGLAAMASTSAAAPDDGAQARATAAAEEPIKPGVDYHSFANVGEFRVRHVDLDLAVDFATHRLEGRADLTVTRERAGARRLVLDTRDLDIGSVALLANDGTQTKLRYELGSPREFLGRPLQIDMPASIDAAGARVRIEYETQPQASGLQWLTPAQTAGKQHPYLFSQSQAIHARSWIPLQDSPQVRVTYSATIYAPAGLRALMSAAHGPVDKKPDANGRVAYRFEMKEAIPSYLIALAVGDIAFRAIGPRTGVYAEPSVLDAAAKEFVDLERMVETCEKLFGPYRWGRYDLLILPPSAPYGGMENPRLSFITPTVIAGDRSLVSVIVHELAHSWSGNLVTNATWRDFWLNEGFTVYLERRIVEALYGARREQMEDVLGLQSLRRELADLGASDQHLAIDLRGRDPDEGTTDVAYEKGKLFLQFLAARFGRDTFDAFLRGYFDHFAFQSIDTEQFLDYLDAKLLAPRPDVVSDQEIHAWVYEPGLPGFAVLPSEDVFAPVDRVRGLWLSGAMPIDTVQAKAKEWSTQEWLRFLDNMPAQLPRARLDELDQRFALSKSSNAEIAHSWFRIAIRNSYSPAYPQLTRYLTTIGRRKLVRPLYEELMKAPGGAALARSIYAKARAGYHPIVQTSIDAIVTPQR
ncbi:MAG TPA: M1 family metallopeptidase [Steroidobacteraceae bacterium]|nr:M1 family metallopeptidase [Steroidobacteraceae bacterium]